MILVFGGTTEGRKAVEVLEEGGLDLLLQYEDRRTGHHPASWATDRRGSRC